MLFQEIKAEFNISQNVIRVQFPRWGLYSSKMHCRSLRCIITDNISFYLKFFSQLYIILTFYSLVPQRQLQTTTITFYATCMLV